MNCELKMDAKISIYLAGSIKKGHEKANESFWTDKDTLFLKKSLPEYEVSFLNPAFRSDNLSDQRSVFGRDMTQVFCSDVVFVDARDRRGLGVGAEMMWAKFHKIPIVTLAPKDSHYNKSKTTLLGVAVEDWVHPFVESLSDAIVEDLAEGATWIRKFVSASAPQTKDVEYIQSTMQYYRDSQLSHDEPMKALIMANQKLHNRIWGVKNELYYRKTKEELFHLQRTPSHQALQEFVRAISDGKFDAVNVVAAVGQEQALDYLMQLMKYCVRFDSTNIPKELHVHPEFFAFPSVEKFCASLFANLDNSLFHKAEAVFLRGLAFTVEYIGPPKSQEVMYGLLEKLQKRFPAFKEMHDKAITIFTEEFFRPTIGEFLDQYKEAEKHLQATFPALHELFVAPLCITQFRDCKLFNFYCNPLIYQRIMNYFAYYARLSFPTIRRDLLEIPLQWLERRLQIIRAQTNAESPPVSG